ncbi:MAG: hypothetical protein OES14_02340, partial [Nitrosopumilus sp.]|nr:hypothetical protein [Nitrosopumilus sp.]
MLIEHPVVVIEELLKLNLGDEGRLLYLRKAITKGQIIYHSDKEFLKRMMIELDEAKSEKIIKLNKSNDGIKLDSVVNDSIDKKSTPVSHQTTNESLNDKNNKVVNNFESEIQSIQNSISELKNKDSKIKDNIGLLLLSREVSTQITIDKSNSFGSFSNLTKNSNADLFSLLKDNPISKKLTTFF